MQCPNCKTEMQIVPCLACEGKGGGKREYFNKQFCEKLERWFECASCKGTGNSTELVCPTCGVGESGS